MKKYSQYQSRVVPIVLSMAAGMLYALGFPLFNGRSIFIAPILGFTLFNWILEKESTLKRQLFLSLFYSLGFYLLGFYWIPHLLKEFGGLNFPFNILLGLIFSLVIIPQVYFYVILRRFTKHTLLLAVGYVLLEQFIPQQFPAHLGHSFISLVPFVSLVFAPLAGAAFYSFFTALLSIAIVEHVRTKKIPKLYYAFFIVVLLCHLPITTQTLSEKKVTTLTVRIVQPNIGNFIKVDSERGGSHSLRKVFDDYYTLSTTNVTTPLDLIIWPETAFPNLFYSDILRENHASSLPTLLEEIIDKTNSDLFIGGYDSTINKDGLSYQSNYNAAFHFSSEKYLKDVYHKRRLIPFGEGLPFGPLNKFLSQYITNIAYFAEGNKFASFTTKNHLNFTAVICYEILFSEFVREALNSQKEEAQFFINLTNDSWYGDTAEPHQHLFLSKWRSLEFNLPIIRSTNTGITTVLYANGSEGKRLNTGEKTSVDVQLLIPQRESTVFQRFGLWGLMMIVLALGFIELVIKRKPFLQKIMQSNKA